MAAAIRDSYESLFHLYGDAPTRDDGDIRNWMRTHADQASPRTIDRALASFRGLCSLADFGIEDSGGSVVMPDAAGSATARSAAVPGPRVDVPSFSSPIPSVHINVELHLPASASAKDYEAFFSAMREHLFDGPSAAD